MSHLEGVAPAPSTPGMAAPASSSAAAAPAAAEDSKQAAAFDELLAGAPKQLAELSAKIGGDCATLGACVAGLLAFNRRVVALAGAAKKPTAEVRNHGVGGEGEGGRGSEGGRR